MICRYFAIAALIGLTACGGGARSGSLPPTSPTVHGPVSRTQGHATIAIRIPKSGLQSVSRRTPSYVSPATTQMVIDVQQSGSSIAGYPQTVALTPTSTGCSSTLASTQCVLTIALSPGSYTTSIALEDASNNALAQLQDYAFTILAGQNNSINLTLGGVATSLMVAPVTQYRMTGSSAAYTIYGNDPIAFEVYPLDADDNIIVGPGAPTPTVSLSSTAYASLTAPTTASPNLWTIQASYHATDPTISQSTSLQISATPVPNSGAATVTTTSAVSIYQPWIYALDESGDSIYAFDEDGNQIATGSFSGGALATGQANGLTYGNGTLYVLGGCIENASISTYSRTGGTPLQTVNSGTSANFGALSTPEGPNGLAFDSHNEQVYMADDNYNTLLLQSYDAALTVGQENSGSGASYGLAYVSTTNQIALASPGGGIVLCNEALNACSSYGSLLNAFGVGWDGNDQYIGVGLPTCCGSSGGIGLYDLSGTYHGAIGTGGTVNGTGAVTYDPFAGYWIEIGQSPSATITTYTTSDTHVVTSGGFGTFPSGDRVGGVVVVR